MIRFQDFSFRYQSGQTEEPAEFALQNINMEIREGEFVGITGTSGAGKSTLTYSISGLIPHHFNGDFYGSVEGQRNGYRRGASRTACSVCR